MTKKIKMYNAQHMRSPGASWRWKICGAVTGAMMLGSALVAAPLEVKVKASSELPQTPAFLAADGDAALPWSPADYSQENWIQFDLSEPQLVETVELMWQSGLNNCDYKLELSADGQEWVEVWKGKGNKSLTGETAKIKKPMKAAHLRVKTKGNRQGLSELKVNGRDLRDPAVAAIPAIPQDAPYRDTGLSPEERAANVVSMMTDYEKFQMAGGYNNRYVRELKRFGLREVFMADASAGIHLLSKFIDAPEPGSISYPCSVALAATWNTDLARDYGQALGLECRQLGVDILLGPGFNLYRTSSNGRNFEYMGEDPVLAGAMATSYIQGMQEEGVMAVAKHFICNNNEWRRHDTDVIIDDRTLHELYMLPWYDVVHNGDVDSIMGSYNWLNGEKVSCGPIALNGLLRGDIGFEGLIMSDWGASWFSDQALVSGLDMSMPVMRDMTVFSEAITPETQGDLDAISQRILTTLFRRGIYDRAQKSPELAADRSEWEAVSLATARQAVTLLKNDGVLPLKSDGDVLVLGPSAGNTCYSGGGSGWVKGYDHANIAPELQRLLGKDKVEYVENWKKVTDAQLKDAESIVVCVDLQTKEGIDYYPKLEEEQEALVQRCVDLNPRTVVVVNSGSGLEMEWDSKAAAVVWAYYPGQYGGTAIAEVITGELNPSGRLPYSIELKFEDSPAYGYIPEGATWTQRKENDVDRSLPECPPVEYKEGVFIGYRWYDEKGLDVRYPFGHGLSYTTFAYEDLKVKTEGDEIVVTAKIRNSGDRAGAEVVQLYVGDRDASVERPIRELKAFARIELKPGQSEEVEFRLNPVALAYYDVDGKNWLVEPGKFTIDIGASSRDIRLSEELNWSKQLRYQRPSDKQSI
ncbi:glycoside hydrolase family 3 C-terminal domain-containing protein [Ruficoccus amylovorans]|uniref:Glycoside hydrolase family 3 C-terminal domain-containing protein n=1 Tax=Ruficoccus amylovorans TaxID=1804625 RepID=A0A842HEA9_9BACT|nr:glycoside hydrolase family 3 C-terminal domain-containing protein [Ruficoccus amylovorans]MBC2593671.1 glycoside hydrolase family 3 C-terminal domain-containing protein [Ruficoccus amylovorans]